MSVAVGKLRHRVDIEQPSSERDAQGGSVDTWQLVRSVWAKVEPLSGREFWAAQEQNSQVTHRVTVRYQDGISTKMRLHFRGRVLHIDSIIDLLEAQDQMQLLCVEVV